MVSLVNMRFQVLMLTLESNMVAVLIKTHVLIVIT